MKRTQQHRIWNFACDGSEINKRNTWAAVVWKKDGESEEHKASLGGNQEIIDADQPGTKPLATYMFCDSQHSSAGRELKMQIYQKSCMVGTASS